MINEEQNQALVSMGYRKCTKQIYGKPVGYSFFTVHFDKSINEITFNCWFKGSSDESIFLWKREKLEEISGREFLRELKSVERYSGKIDFNNESEFQFITGFEYEIDDLLNIIDLNPK